MQNPDQIEELIHKIERLPDPEARANTIALVEALMEFHSGGLERLMEIVAEAGDPGHVIFDKIAADDIISSLLLLYGLHPLPLETRVVQALDKVRPYLDSHGGNVELLGITDGIVRLRMQGSCKSCPSSSMTLKLAIEEAIYGAAPDVMSIEAEGITAESVQTGFVQLGTTRSNGNGRHPDEPNAWEEVSGLSSLADSSIQMRDVRGRSVLFCRLGESVYAYVDNCPACRQPLRGAYLQATSLVCSSCSQRFDVIRAGRGLDQPGLHLEPLPLLFEQGRAKLALPRLAEFPITDLQETGEVEVSGC